MGKELEVMLGVAVGVVACHNGTGLLGDICQAHHLKHLLLVTACLKEAQAKIPKDPKMQWMKKMKNDSLQCLNELAYVLERSGRYDHRGYRASIRKQLRRYLQRRNMPLPDWLEDKGARFIVMQFRDASFDYIQSIKEQEKKRRQPPVPEDPAPNAGNSLPARGKTAAIEQVCNSLEHLKEELACRPAKLRIPSQIADEAAGSPLPPAGKLVGPACSGVARMIGLENKGRSLTVLLRTPQCLKLLPWQHLLLECWFQKQLAEGLEPACL